MKEITTIQVKPLDFLLDCNMADKTATADKLRGRKSIPNKDLVIVDDALFMIEYPTYVGEGLDNRPTLYQLGRKAA